MHSNGDIWQKIQDASTDGFTILEAIRDNNDKIIDFTWTYMNKAGERILSQKWDDLVGKRMLTVSPKSKDNGAFDGYVRVIETGETVTEERFYTINGESVWYRLIIVKIDDDTIGITFSDISVQKALETQLRENEAYLRSITESIPQIVWITRPDGFHEYYNDRWYEYTNTTFNNAKGDGWASFFHPEDQKKAWRLWRKSLRTGEPYEIEYRLKNGKTGEYRWFLGRALPIRDEKGKIVRWFGTCTDIHTQRMAVESQRFLAEASKLLAATLDTKKVLQRVAQLAVPQIADWISIELYDGHSVELGAVAHVDPEKIKWARKLRKERPVDMSENTGLPHVLKTGESVLYPLITEEMIQAAVKSEEELRIIREIGFTSVMIVPITAHKKVIGAVQFVSTDSKKQFNSDDLQMATELAGRISLSMENALLYSEIRQREKQFQALYDSNIIGVAYAGADGTVISANEAFFSIIGYTRGEFNKRTIKWPKLIPPEYKEVESKKLQELYETGVASPFEKEYIRKDGSQVPVIVGKALLDKKKQTSISFVLDITERKKLEQRKDEFLGIASHELKTPLTSIKGYVQILERIIQEMGDDKARVLVSKTNTYIDKLNSLIVDLLDVSKIQAGKLQFNLERFDFSQLVKESVQAIQPTTQHKVTLKSSVKAEITGDRHRIEQVLSNLLTNAIKYSPMGREVIVTMSKDDSYVQIDIQDFGIGIEEQYQRKLFQRFYRVEASAKQFSGLGIGLYISSEIITRHGGRIWLESAPGVGSTFHFTLPLAKGTQ